VGVASLRHEAGGDHEQLGTLQEQVSKHRREAGVVGLELANLPLQDRETQQGCLSDSLSCSLQQSQTHIPDGCQGYESSECGSFYTST